MSARPSIAGRAPRVLIVDDESDNRYLLEVILRAGGFAISSVSSAEDALCAIANAPPELVLMDAMMPGMNGFEATVRIKANEGTKGIPVMIVTALADPQSRERAVTAGASDYLTKPIDRALLLRRVKHLLHTSYPDYREH